mmetsp:Transcript_25893/g.47326  ORF Transcript_25893/g.47326 Transcript_25893/m.47326 type:complete len:275 (+) Transcript_25893:1712-2536(+)
MPHSRPVTVPPSWRSPLIRLYKLLPVSHRAASRTLQALWTVLQTASQALHSAAEAAAPQLRPSRPSSQDCPQLHGARQRVHKLGPCWTHGVQMSLPACSSSQLRQPWLLPTPLVLSSQSPALPPALVLPCVLRAGRAARSPSAGCSAVRAVSALSTRQDSQPSPAWFSQCPWPFGWLRRAWLGTWPLSPPASASASPPSFVAWQTLRSLGSAMSAAWSLCVKKASTARFRCHSSHSQNLTGPIASCLQTREKHRSSSNLTIRRRARLHCEPPRW